MTSWQGSSDDRPTGADGALRAVGLAAVCLGIAALAAAAFVLSYQGIRMVALQAGIEPRYATDYPLLIDAMLVIALAAVLALRGAGLPSRMLSWLTLLVVICAAAGAGILHAKGRTLPHNAAVITAAVLPWALVFVAFVLLLAMLRYARLRQRRRAALAEPAWTHPVADGQGGRQQGRAALATPLPVRSPQPWHSVEIVPGFTSQLVSSAAAGAAAGAAAASVEQLVDEDELQQLLPEPAVQTDEAEPQTSEAEPQAGEVAPETDEAESQTSEAEPQTGEVAPETDEAPPAQTAEDDPRADEAQPQADEYDEEDEMPVFHRIWSSPTPPQG
jgi:hypothetical protein